MKMLAFALLGGGLATAAQAEVIPGDAFSYTYNSFFSPISGGFEAYNEGLGSTVNQRENAILSATVDDAPVPYARAMVVGTADTAGGATALLSYHYVYTAASLGDWQMLAAFLTAGGDPSGAPDGVRIKGTAHLSANGTAFSAVRFEGFNENPPAYLCGYDATGCGTHEFNRVDRLDIGDEADLSFLGTLTIIAQASYSYGSGVGLALVDPVISLNPTYGLNAANYTLALSPGVANASATTVPEPASWALLIAGFGLSGTALRRRRATFAG